MKRFLCPAHSNHLKVRGKSILLSTEKCSICKWEKRPYTLIDLAGHLEMVAADLRFAAQDENYDPFGYTFVDNVEAIFEIWSGMIHENYRKNCHERMKKQIEEWGSNEKLEGK